MPLVPAVKPAEAAALAALYVDCPACEQVSGYPCRNRITGAETKQPHSARVKAARPVAMNGGIQMPLFADAEVIDVPPF